LIVAREGYPYIIVPALLAIALFAIGYWQIALPFVLLAAFMAYFFRDPQRRTPLDENVIVSPADGRVTRVRQSSASFFRLWMSTSTAHR
jgi:phosphatidylserine decarboxylase